MTTNNFNFPVPFLTNLMETKVIVRLKWGLEYIGTLVSFDNRMNIHLRDADEYTTIGSKSDGHVGDVLIRCNNILHIRPKPENYPLVENDQKFDVISNDSVCQDGEE